MKMSTTEHDTRANRLSIISRQQLDNPRFIVKMPGQRQRSESLDD